MYNKTNNIHLSVVIPAYNESQNFKKGALNESMGYLKKQKYSWEIVFVNDGSTDDTQELLTEFCKKNSNCRVITISHGGKPVAEKTGILSAVGKYILYTDFDQSTPLRELDHFLPLVESGEFDIVSGWRGGGSDRKKVDSFFNKFRSKAFAFIATRLFDLNVQDIFCGYKLFTKEAAYKIFPAVTVSIPKKVKGGYMGLTDTEVLLIARKLKLRIKELPVDWQRKPTHGHPIKEPFFVFTKMLELKIADLQGKYNNL